MLLLLLLLFVPAPLLRLLLSYALLFPMLASTPPAAVPLLLPASQRTSICVSFAVGSFSAR
jgi:hypothetical protein